MIKDFRYYTAWTDAMKYEHGYAGLIGYQSKEPDAATRFLWVMAPNFLSECDAEKSADKMLEQIEEINYFGGIIYSDGVML